MNSYEIWSTFRAFMCIVFTVLGTSTWMDGFDIKQGLSSPQPCYLSWCSCVLFIVYLIGDMIVMYCHPEWRRKELIIHHTMCIFVYAYYLNVFSRTLNAILIMETLSCCNFTLSNPNYLVIWRLSACLCIRLPILVSLIYFSCGIGAWGIFTAGSLFVMHDVYIARIMISKLANYCIKA